MADLVQPPTNLSLNTINPPTSYAPSRGQSQSVESLRDNPLAAVGPSNDIVIPIKTECQRSKFNESFNVKIKYEDSVTIGRIIKKAIKVLEQRHKPLLFNAVASYGKTFILQPNTPNVLETPITKYNRSHLISDGVTIQVVLQKYVHKVAYQPITCKHMKAYYEKNHEWRPESCPIYNRMKNEYDHSKANLLHLEKYNHFSNQFEDKPPCRYASNCFAFTRLEAQNQMDFEDLCHVHLYRHPPRQEIIALRSNLNALVINENEDENHPLYEPSANDKAKYQWDEENGYLNALIEEVKRNRYEECLQFDDENDEKQALLSVVDEKLNCLRHKKMSSPLNRAQMLALILYTGAVINHKMCAKQRDDDYDTWKWFDYCLFHGIRLLSINETGEFPLYAGLKRTMLDKKFVDGAFFKTYQSSAWKLEVAMEFVDQVDGGMLIVMDRAFRKNVYCCDVRWISKFPDECEVLISRSLGKENEFSLKVMEKGEKRLNGNILFDIQCVSLHFKAK